MPMTPDEVRALRSSRGSYMPGDTTATNLPGASLGSFLSTIVSPLTLGERLGGVVYNNLVLPTMGAGLRAVGWGDDTVAGEARFGQETAITPDMSTASGWMGLLGVGRPEDTGLRSMDTGKALQGGNTLEAIMRHQGGDVEKFQEDYGVAGDVGMALGNMGLDPLNALQVVGGTQAAYTASKIAARLRQVEGTGAFANTERANILRAALAKQTEWAQGQSTTERFARAFLGEEQPADFFSKGWLMNRSPEFNMAGEAGSATLRSRLGVNWMDRLASRMLDAEDTASIQQQARTMQAAGMSTDDIVRNLDATRRYEHAQTVMEDPITNEELEAYRALHGRITPFNSAAEAISDADLYMAQMPEVDPRMARLIREGVDAYTPSRMTPEPEAPRADRMAWETPEDVPEPVRTELPTQQPVREATQALPTQESAMTARRELPAPKPKRVSMMMEDREAAEKTRELEARRLLEQEEAASPRALAAPKTRQATSAHMNQVHGILSTPTGTKAVQAVARKFGLEPEEVMTIATEAIGRDMARFDATRNTPEKFVLSRLEKRVQDEMRRTREAPQGTSVKSIHDVIGQGDEGGEFTVADTLASTREASPEAKVMTAERVAKMRESYQMLLDQVEADVYMRNMSEAKAQRVTKVLSGFRDMLEAEGDINVAKLARELDIPESSVASIWDDMPALAKRAGVTLENIDYQMVRDGIIKGVAEADLLKHQGVKRIFRDNTGTHFETKNGVIVSVEFDAPMSLASGVDAAMAGRLVTRVGNDLVTYQMDFSKLANPGTIDHEMVHLARSLDGFDPKDWERLVKEYANGVIGERAIEEAVAAGIAKHVKETKIREKIRTLLSRVYEVLTGKRTMRGVLSRWERGKMFEKAPDFRMKMDGTQIMLSEVPEMSAAEKLGERVRGIQQQPGSLEKLFSSSKEAVKKGRGSLLMKAKQKLLDSVIHMAKYGFGDMEELASEYRLTTKLDPRISKGEMRLRALAGKRGLIEDVMTGRATLQGYRNGQPVTYYDRGNMVENILNPIREHFGTKRATTEEIMDMLHQSDVAGVAQRVIAEDRMMTEAIDRIAEGKGTKLDWKRLEKMGITTGYDVMEQGIKEGDTSIVQTLRDTQDAWRPNMMLKTGDDLETAKQALRDFETKGWMKSDKSGFIDKILEQERAISKATVEYAADHGLISREMAETYAKTGDYYTPLERVFDEYDTMRGYGNATAPMTHQALGSAREVMSPVTSVFNRLTAVVRKADENTVWQDLVGDVMEQKAFIASEAKAEKKAAKDIKRATKAGEPLPQAYEAPENLESMKEFVAKSEDIVQEVSGDQRMAADTIRVYKDGKASYWRFTNPEARQEYMDFMTREKSDVLDKLLKGPGSILRTSLSVSPRFNLFNVIRDTITRPIVSQHQGKLRDVLASFGDKETLEMFQRSGGSQHGMAGNIEDAYNADMITYANKIGRSRNTVMANAQMLRDAVRGNFERLQRWTAGGEELNRLAEYRNAYKHITETMPQLTKEEAELYAAYHSRALLDFSKAGSWIRMINRYIPFTNASIQGSAVMFRAAMRDPKAFSYHLTKNVIAPSLATYALAVSSGREKEYQELPAYRRDFFWNIAIPGTKTWLTIPKPFELGVMATGIERALDYARGNKEAFRGYASNVVKGLAPVDETVFMGPFRPLIEVMANRNLFYDQSIVPYWEEGLDVRLRKGAKESGSVARGLASLFGADPRNAEHIVASMFGDYGRLATNIDRSISSESDMTLKNAAIRASGLFRETSPFEWQSSKEAMKRSQLLGIQSTKPAKAFRDILKSAAEGKTGTLEAIMAAQKERERVRSISVEDRIKELLEKQKKKNKT